MYVTDTIYNFSTGTCIAVLVYLRGLYFEYGRLLRYLESTKFSTVGTGRAYALRGSTCTAVGVNTCTARACSDIHTEVPSGTKSVDMRLTPYT